LASGRDDEVQAPATGKESAFASSVSKRGEISVEECDSGARGAAQEAPGSSGATEEQEIIGVFSTSDPMGG